MLVWHILTGDVKQARLFLSRDHNRDYIADMNELTLTGVLTTSGIRAFAISGEKLCYFDSVIRLEILKNVSELNIKVLVPNLARAIISVFGLDTLPEYESSIGDNGLFDDDLIPTNFSREEGAHIDETSLIENLVNHYGKRIMIDVGAHFGGSALKFVQKGWTVHCFEPDPNNRVKLIERLGDNPNVVIDKRALSDRVEDSRPFFRSEISTGISGMLRFEDSHEKIDDVKVSTLTDIIEESGIEKIDFLIKNKDAKVLLFAVPSASEKQRTEILKKLTKYPLEVKLLPSVDNIVNGVVSIDNIKHVEVADILGLTPSKIANSIATYLDKK